MSSKHARLGRCLASARTRAALSLGVVLAVGSTGTFAYWTDDVTVSGTTFTAGTLDLQVNDLNTVAAYTSLNLTTMVPGNSMAGTLVIKNNGNVPLKYTGADRDDQRRRQEPGRQPDRQGHLGRDHGHLAGHHLRRAP